MQAQGALIGGDGKSGASAPPMNSFEHSNLKVDGDDDWMGQMGWYLGHQVCSVFRAHYGAKRRMQGQGTLMGAAQPLLLQFSSLVFIYVCILMTLYLILTVIGRK